MPAHLRIFGQNVDSVMQPVLLSCGPETTCAELVARMGGLNADHAVVVDASGTVAGIVTDSDVTRRIAFKVAPETPVAAVMTRPVFTARSGDPFYRAIARMRRRGLHRLPVVDGANRPLGVLDLRAALATAAASLLRQADLITPREAEEDLQAVKAAQAELAHALLCDNMPAVEVQYLLCQINNDLYRAVAGNTFAAMVEDGWGPPPVECGLMVMGSGGRGESFLLPDQDNGLILANYPDADHPVVDAYYYEFAYRLTRALEAIGFPLCNGQVMATNPLWRKTLPQWREHLTLWGRRRSGVAMLHADIFFDFKVVQGPQIFEEELRRHAIRMARGRPQFLRAMATNESHHRVGLGWFGGFVTDPEEGPHHGQVNLKRNGTLPIVEAVRLYALREGVAATSTLARLDGLVERGAIDGDDADRWRGAFSHLTELLLRRQVADFRAGRPVGNYIDPGGLSSRERDLLLADLKAAEELSRRARADVTGEIL